MLAPEAITRLSKDLAQAASLLSEDEARYLVDSYYAIQEFRKASANQTLALSKSGEPHTIILWLGEQMSGLEGQIKRALDRWTEAQEAGRWLKGVCGIGPIIAAGLLSHIDIAKAPTVGHIWRFAGLDPTLVWAKGKKRPWNASLKTLCWKIGESFVKVSGRSEDFYGRLYVQRKAAEWERNLSGELSGQGAAAVAKKRFGEDTQAKRWYSGKIDPAVARRYLASDESWAKIPDAEPGKGVIMMPPAHIHARAKRWVVKLFLAHYHHVAFRLRFGADPPKPYVISVLGHADIIAPPNFP